MRSRSNEDDRTGGHRSEQRRIRYRIGINIGDIVYDDGDIYGDGVNVAARLEGLADPGGICVARNVYNQVKNKLAFCFEPMGAHRVKNIAEPVEVYRVSTEPIHVCQVNAGVGPVDKMNKSQRADASKSRWAALAAAAVVAIALVGASWWYAGQPGWQTITGAGASGAAETKTALPLPDKPSIAVLPFDNLSGDPKQERLAGGITEDIITDLSRFRELFVIAPDSTEVYKSEAVDVRQVALDLGVQYILRGSLQIHRDRVRVTAQLIDGRNGSLVWAEHYDELLDDIFAVQDDVTNKIAATLAGWDGIVARNRRDMARRSGSGSLQAYDYYLLGMEVNHNLNEKDNEKALEFFRKALELDPNYARPYVGIAWAHNMAHDNDWGPSKKKSLKKWFDASKTAVVLDPSDGMAHMVLGWYYLYTRDMERAYAEIEKAIDLNPNGADTLIHAAGVLSWFGEPERAVETAERAMRLNPRFPDLYHGSARDAYFHARDFEKALRESNKRQNISFWDLVYRPLSYAQLDRKEEAAAAGVELLEHDPEYSAERFLNDNGTYARDTELNLFLESHEKAGLPMCATEEQLAKYPDMKRLEQCEAAARQELRLRRRARPSRGTGGSFRPENRPSRALWATGAGCRETPHRCWYRARPG